MRALLAMLLALLLVLGGAVASYFYLVTDDGGSPPRNIATQKVRPAATAPKVAPPVIEPVEYLDVTREAARLMNRAVPFSKEPNPPAAPLALRLSPLDEARAIDCLAAAAWYEAGDDAVGEQAVVQVVLNRMRHPAFPNTVCGVVFQGSERATGCQFSFTCDGSLRRTPSPAAWARAQAAGAAGLHGLVFTPVGYATHYHTDWVVPNWSSSVDKIVAVKTHLFFRWRGANGKPGAFRQTHAGEEPIIKALASLSPAHRPVAPPALLPDTGATLVPATSAASEATSAPVPATALRGNTLKQSDSASNLYVIQIDPSAFSGTLALVGLNVCKVANGKACTVVGFLGAPGRVASSATGRITWPDRTPDFYYYSDPSRGRETVYWNCKPFPRPNPAQCLPDNYSPLG